MDWLTAIPLWTILAVWLGSIVILGIRRTPIMPRHDGEPLPAFQRGLVDTLAWLVFALGPCVTVVRVTFGPAMLGHPGFAFMSALAIMCMMPGLGGLLQHLISARMPAPPPPGFTVEGATLNGKPLD
ncbi:hypothetical protein [Alteriqipengyuania lutimaris]|uniref:hypothetical protein n=1 Tax=Alteriqipengyuania lutimaris TaxID=1538146 RepID=UPI0011C032D3|nr:hypothetical protein [Alteriqipengyuania lutimaris]MBB3034805.1 hypothetical protein [Alteriqipengyuania lutimaris]